MAIVPLNHVGPTLVQRYTWNRMVGITLAYAAGLVARAKGVKQRWSIAIWELTVVRTF